MEDYFCIPKNIYSAKLYAEYLSKKFYNVVISFSKEDYDLYEIFLIEDFGLRLGIKIIPSIMFRSIEGIILVVFNPSKDALALLEDIKEERTNRIINILYGLSDKFSIHISPRHIIEKLERTDLTDIYIADDSDIIDIIVELKYCKKPEAKNIFNKVNLKRLLLPYNKLIKKLSGERETYIANPELFIDKMNDFRYIKGFILNYKTINDIDKIKTTCLKNYLDLRFGSGKLIY